MKHLLAFVLMISLGVFLGCSDVPPEGEEVGGFLGFGGGEEPAPEPKRAVFDAGSKLVVRMDSTSSTKSVKSVERFLASL